MKDYILKNGKVFNSEKNTLRKKIFLLKMERLLEWIWIFSNQMCLV